MKVEVFYKDAEEETPSEFNAKDISLVQAYGQKYLIIAEKDTTVLINYEAIACIRIHGVVEKIGDVSLFSEID